MIYYHEAYRVFRFDFKDEHSDVKLSPETHHEIRKIVVDAGADMLYDPNEAEILIKIYGSTSAYELLDDVLGIINTGKTE